MGTWVEAVGRDARVAVRRAVRRPAFTAVVVGCLGLGIGATSGVFSVLHPVLLDPVALPGADRLLQVSAYDLERTDPEARYWITWTAFEALERSVEGLEDLAGFAQVDLDIYTEGEARRIAGAQTVPGSFTALSVSPVLGRDISPDDIREGRRTALISTSMWEREFARAPNVLGQSLDVQGTLHTIVGVMPADVRFPLRTELWIVHNPDDLTERERLGAGNLQAIGRLARGHTAATVDTEVKAIGRELEATYPDFFAGESFEASSLRHLTVRTFERPLVALQLGAAFVLLMSLANAATLILARFQSEGSERSVRTALGASQATLLRLGLVENGLLAGAGGVLGLVIAMEGVPLVLGFAPVDDPAFDGVGLSAAVVALTLGLVGAVAGLLALAPLVGRRQRRVDLRGREPGGGRRQRRLQDAFVAAQVGISLVLLVGAALLVRSFDALQTVDPGFQTDRLASVRLSAPPGAASDHERRVAFMAEARERVLGLPGVAAAGLVHTLPIVDGEWVYAHSVEDLPPAVAGDTRLAVGRIVTPGYFDALDIPIRAGRDFSDRDRLDAPWVVIVSESLAEQYWPGENPLGKRIRRGAYEDATRPWMEVVGVVGDVRGGSDLATGARPALYYALGQIDNAYLSVLTLAVKTATSSPASILPGIRATVAELHDRASIFRPLVGSELLGQATARQEFSRLVFALFGLAGLLLASTGVYGLTSYAVGRRTREFGLRMAVGARPGEVKALVLRRAAWLAAVGVGAGVGVAIPGSGLLREILYGVDGRDPRLYATMAAILAVAVLAAAYLPARRITRIDPTVALRDG